MRRSTYSRRAAADRSPGAGPAPGGLAFLALLLPLLLGGCVTVPADRTYESAEEAVSEENWPLAADLWYSIHLAEEVKSQRAYRETAHALYLSGEAESACEMYLAGLVEFPEDLGLLGLYASMLEEIKFKRSAEAYYGRLVRADPQHLEGWIGLGRVCFWLGNENDAEAALRQALALSPDSLEVHVYLAKIRGMSGDAPEAFDHYARAIELGADDLDFLVDAAAVTIKEDLLLARPEARERGLEWIDMVLARDPQSTCAHFLRGVHMKRLDKKNEALVSFMRAVETDPSCVQALTRLALLYKEMGDDLRKVEMATRALDIEQDPLRRQVLEDLLADS